MSELTLVDLVRNGTMNAETAASLASIAAEVVAVPAVRGEEPGPNAILHCAPANAPVHRLSGDEAEMDRLRRDAGGGHLNEFNRAPVPSYIWGPPVRKVFETMRAGVLTFHGLLRRVN